MSDDVSLEVGDQKLTLKKLNDSTSPLVLTYAASPSDEAAVSSFSV